MRPASPERRAPGPSSTRDSPAARVMATGTSSGQEARAAWDRGDSARLDQHDRSRDCFATEHEIRLDGASGRDTEQAREEKADEKPGSSSRPHGTQDEK